MIGARCKICRRLGIKLFLKGERCFSQKCEIIKRNYPPGIRAKKRGGKISDYGKGLMEKQKLRNWYNLSEGQFKRYVKDVLKKKSSKSQAEVHTGDELIKTLESRLDNVVYRLGFASSRAEARQIVNHGHFLVNSKKVDIPSYILKEGDEIELNSSAKKTGKFINLKETIKTFNSPQWLSLDKNNLKGKVIRFPSAEEANVPVETSLIFEFYSK